MIYQLDELPAVARRLLINGANVFALEGELGAGKTTLVAEMCRQLGVSDPVSSPTFSIVNEYRGAKRPVFHLDCYRLKDIDDAMDAGLEELFEYPNAIVFVEWPAVIEPLLPEDVVYLRLHHAPGGEGRELTLSPGIQ